MERSHERFISPNVQIRPKTFKNIYERSKKEDVRERYSSLLSCRFSYIKLKNINKSKMSPLVKENL